jgi:hypothetical protein
MNLNFYISILIALITLGCAEPINENLSPDGKVIQQLQAAGSNLSKPHPIEFFLYAPTKEAAQEIGDSIAKDGFNLKIDKSATDDSWLVVAVRDMIPNEKKLMQIRVKFQQVASSGGGEYDGWGTPIVE